MRPMFRTTSPVFYWALGALFAIGGTFDLVLGIRHGNALDIYRGAAGCALAWFLVVCAVLCHTGRADRLQRPAMIRAGWICFALFAAGLILKMGLGLAR